MAAFVLPRFVVFFKDLNVTLPLPTRMLLGFSDLFQQWWWLLALIVVGFIVAFIASGRSESGLRIRHRFS